MDFRVSDEVGKGETVVDFGASLLTHSRLNTPFVLFVPQSFLFVNKLSRAKWSLLPLT